MTESFHDAFMRAREARAGGEPDGFRRVMEEWRSSQTDPFPFRPDIAARFYRVVCSHPDQTHVVYPFDGEARVVTDTGVRVDGTGKVPAGAKYANEHFGLRCPECRFTERIASPELHRALAVVAQYEHDTEAITNEVELKAIRGIVKLSE